MDQKNKIWQKLEPIVAARGLEIFDLEVPSGKSGFLRVFIARPLAEAGKGPAALISDCTQVSKDILNHPEVEELIPGDCQLEVSSPGVNRKLSRDVHFSGAVGERVRLVVNKASQKEVLRGKLLSFDGKQLAIEDEEKKSREVVDFEAVTEARVDFNFNA